MAPQNYSASFGISNFSIAFWENPKTPHVHDFWILARDNDSQNQLSRTLQTIQEKTARFLKHIILGDLKISEIGFHSGTDRGRQVATIRYSSCVRASF